MLRAERNQACVHFGRDVKGLNIPQHRDVKGYMILNIPLLSPRSVNGEQEDFDDIFPVLATALNSLHKASK